MSEQRSFTANGNTGCDRQYTMWRRMPSGELREVDVDFNEYVDVPKGKRGRFILNGWSPYYETQSTFEGVTKPVTRTRAEYKIVKLTGNPNLAGKLFSQQFPIPRNIDNEKSKLGQFVSALLGVPTIPKGMTVDMDAFIGTEFVTTTTRDDVTDAQGNVRVYCGISWESIDPDETTLSPYVNAAAPEPALVGAGAEDNPFETDEEEDV